MVRTLLSSHLLVTATIILKLTQTKMTDVVDLNAVLIDHYPAVMLVNCT